MEILIGLWPFFKVFLVLLYMVGAMRFKMGLGLAVLTGSLLMGLLFGMGPGPWARAVLAGIVSTRALLLGAVVALIMILSDSMQRLGQSERLMRALSGYLRRKRLRLVFFPALIGLLPMPGGAVFSAPLLENAAQGIDLGRRDKVLINYWFRHIWELCWPLYPGMILAAYLSGMPLIRLLMYTWPGTVVLAFSGWLFVLRPISSVLAAPGEVREKEPVAGLGTLWREGLPLVIAIAGALILEGVLASLNLGLPYELGFIAAFFLAVVCVALQNRVSARGMGRIVFQKHVFKMLFLVMAIFAFKEVLEQSGVVTSMGDFSGTAIALFLSATVLPALVGMISGIAMAFVGSVLPLVLAMAEQMGFGAHKPAFVVLTLFTGFSGVMVSPLHACLLLTCEYFKTDLAGVWGRIARPSLVLFVSGVVYFLVLLKLGV